MPFSTEKLFPSDARQFSFRQMLRRVFLEDWLIKAIALFITVTLWLGVTGLRAPTSARLRGIPLNLRVSNEIEVTNSPVQEVDLVVTGDKRKIDLLNQRDLIVSLDLTDVPAGERTVQMTAENVSIELPTGIRLEEIQPNRIAVRLEGVAEREVTVKAETEGAVAENFEIYNKTVTPAKVRVRGPESFIRSLDSISTEKINLDDRREDFAVRQVALNVVNPKIILLDTVVDVSFKIGEKRIEKTFVVPVKNESGTNKFATVVLYGARSILESLEPDILTVEAVKTEAGENAPNLILPVELQGQVEIKKLKLN
jgi:YbbR domain-containing protein